MRHGADNDHFEIRGENPPQSDQTGEGFSSNFRFLAPKRAEHMSRTNPHVSYRNIVPAVAP